MCESNAYLKDGENDILIMESIDIIEPYEDGLKLMDIFGNQTFIQARIKDMALLNHRINLERLPSPSIQRQYEPPYVPIFDTI